MLLLSTPNLFLYLSIAISYTLFIYNKLIILMGSCMSIHKTYGSSLKLHMSLENDHKPPKMIISMPIEEATQQAIVDHALLSLSYNSKVSPPFSSSYRSNGSSKEETFYDTQAWLDSDCDDDFYSVKGDFTPSQGSTPVHNGVASSRYNKTFLPQLSRAFFQCKTPGGSVSNGSRDSTLIDNWSSSATSPRFHATSFAGGLVSSNQDTVITTKRKKLADLFRESISERDDESLMLVGYENTSSFNAPTALPFKSANGTPHDDSGTNSVSSGSKGTPRATDIHDTDKRIKAAQCCFCRFVPSRIIRDNKKASTISIIV